MLTHPGVGGGGVLVHKVHMRWVTYTFCPTRGFVVPIHKLYMRWVTYIYCRNRGCIVHVNKVYMR